jgi:methionine-rich copper-binding protein CopC
MRRAFAAVAALAAVVALFVTLSITATAHETRRVGAYTLIVGWRSEPTIQGIPNGVFIRVFETAANRNVEGLDKTLAVSVRAGGAPEYKPPLKPIAGSPGQYAGDIIPSRTGDYIFVFAGKVENLDVNESFESGPGRFDVVRSPADITYPDPAAANVELTRQLAELRTTVDQTRLLALAAAVLGTSALVVGLLRGRHRAAGAAALLMVLAGANTAVAAPAATIAFVSSEPAPNARLAASPPRILITFSEEIPLAKSPLRLLRSDGSAVPLPAPTSPRHEQLQVIPPTLAAGLYTVHWKTVDEHDGHGSEGYFAFAVGPDPQVAPLRGSALSASAGGVTAQLDITPGRLGENAYRLRATGATIERASLRFKPSTPVGTTDAALTKEADAFTGKGLELSLPGAYRVTALLRRTGETQDLEIPLDLSAPAPAAATASPSPTAPPSPSPTATPLAVAQSPLSTPAPSPAVDATPLFLVVGAIVLGAAAAAIYLHRRRS